MIDEETKDPHAGDPDEDPALHVGRETADPWEDPAQDDWPVEVVDVVNGRVST